ncbi:MAG: hypothetical protein ACTSUE_11685 [Promethearchaeota archaeon]
MRIRINHEGSLRDPDPHLPAGRAGHHYIGEARVACSGEIM